MREIVFDTETTGLDPYQGHRLVEIGCIEMLNRFATGEVFHRYINPEREMPAEAEAVHGLTVAFLRDKPVFADIAVELIEFIGDSPLVAHNATFDLSFLNAELERVRHPPVQRDRLVDTLILARRKYPGSPNRLDDLCSRFGIDLSRRTRHGALLDAELLAEVYMELIGARQAQLGLVAAIEPRFTSVGGVPRTRPVPLVSRIDDADRAAHRALIATLGTTAVWNDYIAAAA
jgi:DNA polymerase III subunit epsilon